MTGKGQSIANGNSMASGPLNPFPKTGWDIKPVTHWDATEGRLPQ